MTRNSTDSENEWRKIFSLIWQGAEWLRTRFSALTTHPRVITFSSFVIFIWSLNIISRELKHFSPSDLAQAFDDVRISTTSLAILSATISYLALSFNDRFSLSMIGKRLLLGRTILASLATNALAKTLGYSWAIAATARSKLYRKWGLTAAEIGALSATTGMMVFIGAISVAGLGLLAGANEIARHGRISAAIWLGVALALLLPAIAWLLFSLKGPKNFKWGQTTIFRPRSARALAHLAITMFDKIGAGLALYILLPDHGGWSLPAFLAVFTLAGILGALSGAPGGLGVFEATILAMAPNSQNIPGAAVALVFYRLIYNVGPLVGATVIMGLDHARFIAKPADRAARHIGKHAADIGPQILAILAFAFGFVLIGATILPSQFTNLFWRNSQAPLPVFDILHCLCAVYGMALMVTACGLWRESRSSLYIVLMIMAVGFITTCAAGAKWPLLASNVMIILLLLFGRTEFQLPLCDVKRSLGFAWISAILGSLIAIIWYAYFLYQGVQYSHTLWTETGSNAVAARTLRALTASILVFAFSTFAIWLFAPQKPIKKH